jgi:hypothetical protein
MNYSLAACIAFCLRPFMNAVRTNYGTAGDVTLSTSSGTRSHGYADLSKESSGVNEGFPMLPLRKKRNERGSTIDGHGIPSSSEVGQGNIQTAGLFRPKGAGLTVCTAAVEEGHDDSSMGSDRSSKMIIRKDVQYAVKHSPRRRSDTSRY